MPAPARAVAAVALCSILCAAAPLARADKCDEAATEKKQNGKNWHWETIGGKKVQVIDTIISVCGKVPRPNVVYVLQAKSINYEWENLKQDFLPLIIASVKKAPF